MWQRQQHSEGNRYRLSAMPTEKRRESVAEYSAYGDSYQGNFRYSERGMGQKNERYAFGDIKKHGQITEFLTARPKDIGCPGIPIAVIPDIFTQEPSTDK